MFCHLQQNRFLLKLLHERWVIDDWQQLYMSVQYVLLWQRFALTGAHCAGGAGYYWLIHTFGRSSPYSEAKQETKWSNTPLNDVTLTDCRLRQRRNEIFFGITYLSIEFMRTTCLCRMSLTITTCFFIFDGVLVHVIYRKYRNGWVWIQIHGRTS